MTLKAFIFPILLVMIFSNVEPNAQTMPPVEPGVSQVLARWRAANYSDVRYKLNITLEKQAPLMKGEIEIRVNLTEEGAKNDLILDWRTTQFENDKDKPFARVLRMNGAVFSTATPYEEKEHIIIPKGVLRKGENEFLIEFASPIKTSGAAVTRYVDKEDGSEYIYSLFVPSDASTAFPVFDQPDLKARFSLTVKTYRDWKVVSNTLPKHIQILPTSHSEAAGKKINETAFEETKPMSTYVFAFAAGDFAEIEDQTKEKLDEKVAKHILDKGKKPIYFSEDEFPSKTSLKIYVRKSQAEKFKPHAKEVFRLNREAVKYFEEYFDYKFPFPKYDLVLIPEFPFGGMEHAGATFLRESSIIFPTEPTANDYISRASLIFHEAAHQWFGDTVTMRWFDDLWLKEGFATFMAYKAMENLMPEYDIWKVFYERTKQRAYLTDVTRGTTPIYQEIPNLSAAKSAYGNIVYQKAPSFLKQTEFNLGEKAFQTAVRSFLKKHEFANAEWADLVRSFEKATGSNLDNWANVWVKKRSLPIIRLKKESLHSYEKLGRPHDTAHIYTLTQENVLGEEGVWQMKTKVLLRFGDDQTEVKEVTLSEKEENPKHGFARYWIDIQSNPDFQPSTPKLVFPNYQDYGYGIFLLDERSRKYILENIQDEKDSFLRAMMWGSLWDSVRFYELDPRDYVELVLKNIDVEKDVVTIASLLNRVSIALTYYIESEPSAVADGLTPQKRNVANNKKASNRKLQPSAAADGSDLSARIEKLLLIKIKTAPSIEQKITFYRAFLNLAASSEARHFLKELLAGKASLKGVDLKTKDKFDIVTKLIILGDRDALKLLAKLEKTETDDAARRYAYAARAGIPTAENKAKYWEDFVANRELSESWIEEAFEVWNTPRHADLTLPYLEKALAELPELKRTRKIFFVNGWLAEFIGGQKSPGALEKIERFLEENPDLDRDLRLKILENMDGLERAVRIRSKFASV